MFVITAKPYNLAHSLTFGTVFFYEIESSPLNLNTAMNGN